LQSRQERKFSPLVSTSEGKGGKEMRREWRKIGYLPRQERKFSAV
jgi:hypothetical protein